MLPNKQNPLMFTIPESSPTPTPPSYRPPWQREQVVLKLSLQECNRLRKGGIFAFAAADHRHEVTLNIQPTFFDLGMK